MAESTDPLTAQLDYMVKGAEEFKAKHGTCRITVGPNAPVALARIERVAGFTIHVENITLVSPQADEEDVVIDGPLVYYRACEHDGITAKDVVAGVDWLGSMGALVFDSANYSSVESTGSVYLEGRRGDYLVDATFVLTDFNVQPDDDGCSWVDDDETDD